MKDDFLLGLGIAFLYVFLNILGITCPIKFLTGCSCAGCGMTRAWVSVFIGDFPRAFYFHPLFIFVPFLGIIFCLRRRISLERKRLIIFVVVTIFMITYLLRIFLGPKDIVGINIRDGFLFKIVSMGLDMLIN